MWSNVVLIKEFMNYFRVITCMVTGREPHLFPPVTSFPLSGGQGDLLGVEFQEAERGKHGSPGDPLLEV